MIKNIIRIKMKKNNYTGFEIIKETDNYFIINKFKNSLVQPTVYEKGTTIIDQLKDKINTEEFEDKERPGIIQRLDKQTTGLFIIVKNKKTEEYFKKQLEEEKLIKKYIAIVHNRMKEEHLMVKLPLSRVPGKNKFKVSQDEKSKMAITEIINLENYQFSSLIECILHTGRTHQIRVHLTYIHHPIFNDLLYGKNDGFPKEYGQFLHSYKISFIDPQTKKVVNFKCEPDETFLKLKDKLMKGNLIKSD
jgi:23S rRNA pseudouridine1911/1915/1917 synthase